MTGLESPDEKIRPGDTVTLGPVELRDPQGEVTYQWYFNGEPILDATDSSLTIADITFNERGAYHVMVDDDRESTPVKSSYAIVPAWTEPGWPRYRLDAARSAQTAENVSLPLRPEWVIEPDRRPSPAWPDPGKEPHRMPFDYAPVPVIAHGLMYVGSTTDDSVRAFDAETGELQWIFTTGGPVRFAPDVYDGRAYVASDDGYLYCLDAFTGELLWRFRAAPGDDMVLGNGRMISRWPLRSGVLVDKGVIYTTAGMWPSEGVVIYALDAVSGSVRWKNDTTVNYIPQPHGGAFSLTGVAPQGYLAIGGDVLLVAAGRAVPAAFNRANGELLYYRQSENARRGGAWLQVDAKRNMFFNSAIYGEDAYRLSNGVRIGRVIPNRYDYIPEGRIRTADIVLRGGIGRITAHRVGGLGAERRLYGGEVYAHFEVTEYDAVYRRADAYALETVPEPLWSAEVKGYVRRLAAAGGRLYASTDDGRIYCFAPGEPADGEEIRRIAADPSAAEAPEPGPLVRTAVSELERSGINKGYALLLGEPEPDLALTLAEATEMHVLLAMDSPEETSNLRRRLLEETDLYGTRIAALTLEGGDELPFSPYFANIVIGGHDQPNLPLEHVFRVLRPAGGIWLPGADEAAVRAMLSGMDDPAAEVKESPQGPVIVRGKLPGAFDWDSEAPADEHLRWPLSLSWFGGPGPARMVDRHRGGPMPIAAGGRYFHVANHHVIAVDAYNGTELWSRSVPYAVGIRRDERHTLESLAADDESVYLNFGSVCYRLDAQSGRQQEVYGEFRTPQRRRLDGPQRFEFDVTGNANSSGTVTLTPEEDGLHIDLETQDEAVTEFDSWELFFDFRPRERRADIYEPDDLDMFRVYVQAKSGRPRPYLRSGVREHWEPDDASARPPMDFQGFREEGTQLHLFLPWDGVPAAAGEQPEEFAFNATHERSSGEGELRTHLFGDENTPGTFNNGWPVFVLGDGPLGEGQAPEVKGLEEVPQRFLQWGRRPSRPHDERYAGQRIRAFTGETQAIQGRLSRNFYRRSYGCGPVVSSSQMDFFRSATLGYYDIEDDSGVRNFGGMRPGCSTAPVPALGLLISSEASSGCTCSYNFQTSLALTSSERRRYEDWAIYYEPGSIRGPLNRASVNLGAPGDRRSDGGYLWFGYPRTVAVWHERGLELPVTVQWDQRFGPERVNADFTEIHGSDKPWVHASSIRGIEKAKVDLGFYSPELTTVSTPVDEPPLIDGSLDEQAWQGRDGIELPGRASVKLSHDDKNLYVGYEQHAHVDRRGQKRPWRLPSDDKDRPVWEKDHIELRFGARRAGRGDLVRFAVSASGTRYDSHWAPGADVPRLDALTLDGDSGGWDGEGFRARIAAGLKSRFAWNDEGLWLLITADTNVMEEEEEDMPARSIAFIAAKPGREAAENHLRLELDLTERTWNAVLRRDGEESEGGVELRERSAGHRHIIEVLFPWDELNIAPEKDAEVALPIWYCLSDASGFSPGRVDSELRPLFHDRRQWRTIPRLRLSQEASSPTEVIFEKNGRGLACFEAGEDASWEGDWNSEVNLTDELFVAELAIPWSDIERFGLNRDDLLVDFGEAPPTDGSGGRRLKFDETGARTLHLQGGKVAPGLCTVRLHFAELDEDVAEGDRVFDVVLQGEMVLRGLDVVREAGGHRRALVRELHGVPAGEAMKIEFISRSPKPPILSGFELEEAEDGRR